MIWWVLVDVQNFLWQKLQGSTGKQVKKLCPLNDRIAIGWLQRLLDEEILDLKLMFEEKSGCERRKPNIWSISGVGGRRTLTNCHVHVVGPRPLDGRGVFCTRWMLRNWSGVGGGGDDHIPCTCTHVGCCATGQGWVGGGGWSHSLHLHTCWMLRNWSGVGGGGDDHIPCTCTHVGCCATGQGWVGGGDDRIPCTCTHVGCCATGQGWVGGGGWSHSLHLHTRWMLRNWSGMITFLALAHTLDATQLVGDDHISCTCTHVGWSTKVLGRTRKVAVTKRKCPTAPLLLQGMKACQIQLVSDFVKTPKVLVSPRRNANFSTSACKSRVKQWKNRMEPIPIGRNT